VVGILAALVSNVKRSQVLRLVLVGMVCLFVGAALFAATQGLSFPTALYWAITTATTVGYGDVVPKNPAGRAIAVGVMVTTIPLFASAFALLAGAVVSARLRRLLGMGHVHPGPGTVVIFGMSPVVARVAHDLVDAGRTVMVVANVDRALLPDSVELIAADPTSEAGLRRSHPEEAGQLLVTGANDADVLVTAVLLRHIAPKVPALALASSKSVCQALTELGIGTAIAADELLVHTLAKSLEAPHAGELLLHLMGSEDYQLVEKPIGVDQAGRNLSAVRSEHDGLVLGAVHNGAVVLGIGQDLLLSDGDLLVVLEPESS